LIADPHRHARLRPQGATDVTDLYGENRIAGGEDRGAGHRQAELHNARRGSHKSGIPKDVECTGGTRIRDDVEPAAESIQGVCDLLRGAKIRRREPPNDAVRTDARASVAERARRFDLQIGTHGGIIGVGVEDHLSRRHTVRSGRRLNH